METKTFELLEKLYSEFVGFKKDITEKVENNSKEIQHVGNQVTTLESTLKDQTKALFDGYKQAYDKLEVLDAKIDDLSGKIEMQDVEIKVIKGGR